MNVTLVVFIVLFIIKILGIKDISWWAIATVFIAAMIVAAIDLLLTTKGAEK